MRVYAGSTQIAWLTKIVRYDRRGKRDCTHLFQKSGRVVVAQVNLLLSTDTGSVDTLGEALVYVPIEVELVHQLFGVGEGGRGVLLVRFEGVEEGGEGRGGEGIAGLGEGGGR